MNILDKLIGPKNLILHLFNFKIQKTTIDKSIKAKRDITAMGDIITGTKVISENSSNHLRRFIKLVEKSKWRKEIIKDTETWICSEDNTFQIVKGETGREFHEDWTDRHPDKQDSYRVPVYLKIGESVIKQLLFISCDGGRIFVPIPERKTNNNGNIQEFFWIENSLEFKIAKLIGVFYQYRTIEGVARRSRIEIV